jgi:hypothetical protein
MNSTSTHRLLSAANGATALLGCLNLDELPALATLQIGQNHRDGWRTGVTAQLTSYGLSESEQIDAIRTWAMALNGVLRLDAEDYQDGDKTHRQLAAVAVLPDGSQFEVWIFLYRAAAPADHLAAV